MHTLRKYESIIAKYLSKITEGDMRGDGKMIGVKSFGAYVPRYRLNRKLIYKAIGWMDPSTIAYSKGDKAVANYDEDSLTMAVAAGLEAIRWQDRSRVDVIYIASTTLAYKERLNAGIVSGALALADEVRAADFSGGLKAGTTALASALDSVAAGHVRDVLVCSADSRLGRPASAEEMVFGDAAAAFLVGRENVIAEYKGAFCLTCDFMDHYRGEYAKFDRKWEDRWIRDMGFAVLIPRTVEGLLERYNLRITDFRKVIYDCHYTAERSRLNKKLGILPEMEQTNLQEQVGYCGTAQSLLMFTAALQTAQPGDKILVISYGSGCDALYFEVTENILKGDWTNVLSRSLSNRAELDLYEKYLIWRDVLPVDKGLRSEEDIWTRPSILHRKRREVLGLWGSRCRNCGTPQYPVQRICVNPLCGAMDDMEDYLFSDKTGKIVSFTSDILAPTLNPPAIYGAVEFEGGGKFYFDFTDCRADDVQVGVPVTLSFRRKYFDKARGISGYFWKAVPIKEAK